MESVAIDSGSARAASARAITAAKSITGVLKRHCQ
jgi:hypothetical protein